MPRTAEVIRKTKETDISVRIRLDGAGGSRVRTGVGFFDHMLETLARHGGFDLDVEARGDLQTGDHHTVEDVGLCIGEAFSKALGDKRGIVRFGCAYCPMDEALARAVVDLSGRPHAECGINLPFSDIANFRGDSIIEFLRALANAGAFTVHLDLIRGGNIHHSLEALFKALALALRQAVVVRPGDSSVPSTKGTL
jgi:imidazoleglycerol-phosphate dehydratase